MDNVKYDVKIINKAKKAYENGKSYKDISKKCGVPENTLKYWKRKYDWKRNAGTKPNSGAPKGSKNAAGGPGGDGGPEGNKKAEKHGFFSKWLPPETLQIIEDMEQKSPADILWEQIEIQYAAIIRAQTLMYVKDKQDITVSVTSESAMGTSYDVQQAWDKHERFLSAQSRAMTTLNGLINQYEKLTNKDELDERKERLNKLRLESERIKAETERIKADKGIGSGTVIFAGEGDLID